jgi:oligoribonuclease (3'-5' exoribonuclease)
LLGSTVSFDRRWIRHHLSEIEALFNHRSIDVSSITECASRWNRSVYAARPRQDKHVPHRALDDARNSAEYLRYYQQSFLLTDLR